MLKSIRTSPIGSAASRGHAAFQVSLKLGLTSRQEARERRIVTTVKPFRWNPAGNQSRPVEPDQQPEASLAWWVGDHPCEASTARSNAVRLSPEIRTRGEPSSWSVAGAAPGNLLMVHSACLVTPGSEEYGE